MIIPRSIKYFVSSFLWLTFAALGVAGERKVWLHSDGHFENTKETHWEEKASDGTHQFVEKERTDKFIELFDKSRECYVRLYDDRCEAKIQKGDFKKIYDGTWRTEPVNIAGIWDSEWGFVTLQTTPGKEKRHFAVTGSYLREKDQKGLIKSGSFDSATNIFEFTFEEPWRGDQTRGTAKLTLSIDGNHFKGKFKTINEKKEEDKGELVLTRVRGQDFLTRVASIVADAGIKADTPGVAVMVLEHGSPIFRRSYGLANLRDKKPINHETTFELASCSKQFAGTAILLLYEQGKLALEDDIRKYLPEMPEYDKKNPIRILNLARHTSGLPEYFDLPNVKGKDPKFVTNEDYVGAFARERKKFPLQFRTGSDWRYTNTNYLLLALIVERVSKQSFGSFLKKEIFDPLGMKTAMVYDRPNVSPHEAALGYHKEKNGFEESWGTPPLRHETLLTAGDGSVWASLDDLARWDEGWRQGKVLKPATIKKALVPSKYGDDQTTDYAFGWGVTLENGKIVHMSHNGAWGSFLTYIDRNVAEDRTLIVLSNVDSLNIDAIVRLYRWMPPKGKK